MRNRKVTSVAVTWAIKAARRPDRARCDEAGLPVCEDNWHFTNPHDALTAPVASAGCVQAVQLWQASAGASKFSSHPLDSPTRRRWAEGSVERHKVRLQQWGDQGYSKIKRGNDECGIEDDVTGITF